MDWQLYIHQPRHVRVLAWLDPGHTRGTAISKGKGMLVEGGSLVCANDMTILGKSEICTRHGLPALA